MANKILAYIGFFILIINFICFLKSFTWKGKALKVFTYYLGAIGVVQAISILFWLLRKNNLVISHFYFLLQFVFLSLFYKELLSTKKTSKMIKISFIIVPLIVSIQYAVNFKLFMKFNLLEILLTSVPILILSLKYYFKQLTSRSFFSYVNTGIFFYLLGSTLIFASANITTGLSRELNMYLWRLNSVFFIAFQLLIFFEWHKNLRYKKKSLGFN